MEGLKGAILLVGCGNKMYDKFYLAGIDLPEETKIQVIEVCDRYDIDVDTFVNIMQDNSKVSDLSDLENYCVTYKNNKKKNKSKNWNKKRFYD